MLINYLENFIIEVTNIKDPKGLVDYMVKQAASPQLDNPSKYIKRSGSW